MLAIAMTASLSRRGFLALLGAAACSRAPEPPVEKRPNIVLVVADDQGYADVGFHGSPDCRTPRLDAIAREGVRFDNGYVTHPFCSPSRAGLMTGRYQQRFGYENNMVVDPDDPATGIPPEERMLPELLAEAGYATSFVGKWHLGAHPRFHPFERGFQHMYGFIGGGHDYFEHGYPGAKDQHLYPIVRNGEVVEEKTYLTTALGREAADYVRQTAGRPFFLYLAFNAPHSPLQAPDEMLEQFAHLPDVRRRTYAAMVWAMDEAIGQVDDALAEKGLKDDTLFVFINDNGGPAGNASDNTPLRGTKRTLYEGGVRVPFLMRWPGTIREGSVYSQPVGAWDILPTALAAAGAPLPADREIDGVDLLPYLSGEKAGAPHERLFWRCFDGHEAAVREGNWKWVRNGPDAKPELFDLSKDIGEKHDLADEQSEVAERLEAAWNGWSAQMAPSAWPDHIYHVGQGRKWR